MFREFGAGGFNGGFDGRGSADPAIARSGQLDPLVALEGTGTRQSLTRDQQIYAEGDASDAWYRVVLGAVRISKLLADGRRYIAEFCFSGDCFGLDTASERGFSAEAVGDVVVMRYSRRATDRLISENAQLARCLCDMTLRDLAHAQTHMMLLGRMTASERVASFLLDMFDRRDATHALDLPMSRNDIADYLGLTIETVCRVMSAFKRDGTIGIPTPQHIELRDRAALATIGEA